MNMPVLLNGELTRPLRSEHAVRIQRHKARWKPIFREAFEGTPVNAVGRRGVLWAMREAAAREIVEVRHASVPSNHPHRDRLIFLKDQEYQLVEHSFGLMNRDRQLRDVRAEIARLEDEA